MTFYKAFVILAVGCFLGLTGGYFFGEYVGRNTPEFLLFLFGPDRLGVVNVLRGISARDMGSVPMNSGEMIRIGMRNAGVGWGLTNGVLLGFISAWVVIVGVSISDRQAKKAGRNEG